MDGLRICGVADHFGTEAVSKWEDGHISYAVLDSLPGLSDDDWLASIASWFSSWGAFANVSGQLVDKAAQANLLIGVGPIDGPSNVLACSEMPPGIAPRTLTLRQRYDSGELHWVRSVTPRQGELDIDRVGKHEVGHFFGLPHFAAGAKALLAPTYSLAISEPQAMDVIEMVSRYGRPVRPPTVPPVVPSIPTGGKGMDLLLTILEYLLPMARKAAAETKTPMDDFILDLFAGIIAKRKAGTLTASDVVQVKAMLGVE